MNRKTNESGKVLSGQSAVISQKLLKPLGAFVFFVVLVVGLIYTTTPSNNLVPYDQFKEAAAVEKVATNTVVASDNPPQEDKKAVAQKRRELKALAKSLTQKPSKRTIALPKQAFIHIGNGMRLAEDGKDEAANDEFEKAAMISPDSAEIYSLWGVAMRMAERYEEAEKRFARAYELSPDDDEITFNYGMSQLHANKIGNAIELFRKTIKINPKYHMAYNLWGKALGREKQFVKESAMYVKAIEIKPDFALAHFNLGVVLALRKMFIEAVPHFLKAGELDKKYAKPFVVQFLKRYGPIRDAIEASKRVKAEAVAQGKDPREALTKLIEEATVEDRKHSNSGYKMVEPSEELEKDTTNLSGNILINGENIPPNAVVYLETKDKLPVPEQRKPRTLTITQKGLKFVPQYSVVMVNSKLKFVNSDKEPHNIYSKSLNNQFNLGGMAPGSEKTIQVSDAGPITLRCNIHKEMIGTVFVVPNGYYTQPTKTGEYLFENVKSKEYFLSVWHPRLYPQEVMESSRSIGLTGKAKVINFKIQSASQAGEIHDLVDETDYEAIVSNIEKLVYQGIEGWKQGKKYLPQKRLLMAITRHYEGEGLKGAIVKSFSEKRGVLLENELDGIRKKVSGIKVDDGKPVTEESLKHTAKLVISQLRADARELKARVDPLQK